MNRSRHIGLMIILFCISLGFTNKLSAQQNVNYYTPVVGLKTNLLYWGATTPNLGLEFTLGGRTTMDIIGTYNPWEFKDDKFFKHWLIQPEVRIWLCERFNGHFFGIHGHYAEFNVSNLKIIGTQNYRHQGNLYGGGISYGYSWIIGKKWNLEATIGVGYARINYDKYECGDCKPLLESKHKNYFGPTKAGISFVYIIK